MTKAVIELLRVSTEFQAREDRAGLAAQRAANRRTAAQFDLKIIDTIELVDVSGDQRAVCPWLSTTAINDCRPERSRSSGEEI